MINISLKTSISFLSFKEYTYLAISELCVILHDYPN